MGLAGAKLVDRKEMSMVEKRAPSFRINFDNGECYPEEQDEMCEMEPWKFYRLEIHGEDEILVAYTKDWLLENLPGLSDDAEAMKKSVAKKIEAGIHLQYAPNVLQADGYYHPDQPKTNCQEKS